MTWHPQLGNIASTELSKWLSGLAPSPPVRRSIVIASEERSGSEWLCQLMTATGSVGRPAEYLNAPWFRNFIPDYPEDAAAEMAIAHRAGTTPNGIFAMKIHPWQFDKLMKEGVLLSEAFPQRVFLWISRRDRLRQAISLFRARQTDRYHEYRQPQALEQYDRTSILHTLDEIVQSSARWTQYFARNGIDPLVVWYEDLEANSIGTIEAVARLVDVSFAQQSGTVERELKKQRDDTTEEWRQRFLSEARDIDRLDTVWDSFSRLPNAVMQARSAELVPGIRNPRSEG